MVYTKEQFKRLWEANSAGSGITFDDIAECAIAWGISSHPRTRPIDEITYKVLKAAQTNDAEEYNPNPAPKESERMKKAIRHILYENYTDAAVIEGVEIAEIVAWLEKQGEQQGKSALEAWRDMRFEVYQQASGNRHEANYSDDSTKMFSLNDIDEIIEKISEQKGGND